MMCSRCHGLMLPERADDGGIDRLMLYFCINCGDRLDEVILAHRQHRPDKGPTVLGPRYQVLG